mmetsp:Transcript_16302/g.53105  ORF Transcript_16302/g.53105 Transcript_16302/m.53105 type:complete len:89 (-) Transcript_16302:104-370(-)
MKEWLKLLKVGLPRAAVAKKMREEGIDPALLEMDLAKPPTAEALAMLARNEEEKKGLPRRRWAGRSSFFRSSVTGRRRSRPASGSGRA